MPWDDQNCDVLKLQRGWSKLIRILLVSSALEIMMVYWQSLMKVRK